MHWSQIEDIISFVAWSDLVEPFSVLNTSIFQDLEAEPDQEEEMEDMEKETAQNTEESSPEEEKSKYEKKKEKLKKLFDADYDENGDESKYFADLQEEADAQTRTNKEFFADEAHRER